MGGLHDHRHPLGTEVVHEQVGDLFGHPFLYLRAMRQGLHNAGQLAQAEDSAVGQVADVSVAHEWKKVMLADAVEGDVADEHDLVVFFGERLAKMHLRIGVQPAEHLRIHAGHAARRFQEPLAIGVLAYGQQDLSHSPFDAGMVDGAAGRRTVSAAVRVPFWVQRIGIAGGGSGLHNRHSTTPCSVPDTCVERPKPRGAVKASDSKRGYADSLRLAPTPGSVCVEIGRQRGIAVWPNSR